MQLIQAHGQTFIRQQWIYKGEIQNRVFGFADVSSFKVAVKVKGQYGQGFNQPELATVRTTILSNEKNTPCVKYLIYK